MKLILTLALVLCGCDSGFVAQDGGAIGVGLTAGLTVEREECHYNIYTGDDCGNVALPLTSARSTTPGCEVRATEDFEARVRCDRVGPAHFVLETRNGTYEADLDIIELPSQWLHPSFVVTGYSPDLVAFFPGSRVLMTQGFASPNMLGETDISFDPGTTTASVTERSYRQDRTTEIETGDQAGVGKLVGESGMSRALHVVTVADIARLELVPYAPGAVASPVDFDFAGRFLIVPLTAAGEPIAGASPTPPTVTTDGPVHYVVSEGEYGGGRWVLDTYGSRDAVGRITVSWGAATADLDVTSPW